MKKVPMVQKYMTGMPQTIGMDIPVKTAFDLMRENRYRHLPVQKAGKLVGILTDRDIKLAASFSHAGDLVVEDVMTPDPYTVHPETTLDQVVSEMAEHKYGCAVVQQDNGKVVGIFTTTDGMRVLSDLMQTQFAPRAN